MEAKDAAVKWEAAGGAPEGETAPPSQCVDAVAACGFEPELIKLLPLAKMPSMELRELVHNFATSTGQVLDLAKVSNEAAHTIDPMRVVHH